MFADRHVERKLFIAEAQAGLGLIIMGARLTYTHVMQTEQFKNQKGGQHQFSPLALSVRL